MKRIIFLLLLIIALFGAYYFYKEYNRTAVPVSQLKSINIFTPNELYTEFKDNETAANLKYLNKPIEVVGKIVATNTAENGITTVAIDSGDPMGVISCELSSSENPKISKLAPLDNIRIKGICTGFLTDVILNNCVILSVDNKL